MTTQKIITELKNVILQWDKTSTGNGDFGATTFLYRRKEFGHIHHNGELDIAFGKTITAALRQANLVQKHLYVPGTSISYPVSSEERLPFAISLLRFSYLIRFKSANEHDSASESTVEREMSKLPESLSSIYLKQE